MELAVLLHFYEGDVFLGQTLSFFKADVWIQVADAIQRTYPAGHLRPGPPLSQHVQIHLPALEQGYSSKTNVRVMQIIRLDQE